MLHNRAQTQKLTEWSADSTLRAFKNAIKVQTFACFNLRKKKGYTTRAPPMMVWVCWASSSEHELRCATTSKLVQTSIWFLWSFWVVCVLFNHFFRVITALIIVLTTHWSSKALVVRNCTCILALNTSIMFNWMVFVISTFRLLANLEETSMNVLGPVIYWLWWGA